MGESSKTIGEIGESYAKGFFELIGWSQSISGETLNCNHGKEHKRKTAANDRKTHGIDRFFNYISPLDNNQLNNILISVKNSNDVYPNNPSSKFKEYLTDLEQVLSCYKHSELKNEHQGMHQGYQKHSDIGLLIWFSASADDFDVVSKLENIQLTDFSFDIIYVIDNARVKYIYDVITFLQQNYGNRNIEYHYDKTNFNFENSGIQHGKIMPIEYLTAPNIPFKIASNNGEKLCISSVDNFDEEEFSLLLYRARKYISDFDIDLVFLFPDYVKDKHEKIVNKAIISQKIDNNIEVTSFRPSFRSLNNG